MNHKHNADKPNNQSDIYNEMIIASYTLSRCHSDAEHKDFYNKMIVLSENNVSPLIMSKAILQELSAYNLKLPEQLANTSGDTLISYVNLFMGFYEYGIKLKNKKESTL